MAIGVSKGRAAPSVLREDAYAGVKAASQYLQAAGVGNVSKLVMAMIVDVNMLKIN